MNFARVSKIESLFAFPSLALVIAEGVVKQAGEGAREAFKKERTLRNLLMAVAASVIPIKAKNVFKFRRGVFAGEPVEPYRKAILDAYGFEPNMAYGATEFSTPLVGECSAQRWDAHRVGLFPARDHPRERAREGRGFFWPCAPGDSDLEDVGRAHRRAGAHQLLRCFASDPLPDFRPGPGRQHRALRLWPHSPPHSDPSPQRRHSELGLIRFSIYELKTKMEQVGTNGQVANWQLRITRVQLQTQGSWCWCSPVAEAMAGEPLLKEIKDKVDELPGVRQAWERGLIAEPEVRLVGSGGRGADRLPARSKWQSTKSEYFDGDSMLKNEGLDKREA